MLKALVVVVTSYLSGNQSIGFSPSYWKDNKQKFYLVEKLWFAEHQQHISVSL